MERSPSITVGIVECTDQVLISAATFEPVASGPLPGRPRSYLGQSVDPRAKFPSVLFFRKGSASPGGTIRVSSHQIRPFAVSVFRPKRFVSSL